MKARILLRVSTDKQAKAGTIAAQRPRVRELAARLGVTEADMIEYVEEAVSGAAPLDERDVLLKLLAEAERGDFVCAYDLSRLTRSDDWETRYMVLGRLRTAELRPATVEDGEIDLHTVGGRITTHIRAEIAAEERKKIRDRTMNGKNEAARQGRKPQGVTPYGLRYDRTTRQWSIVEENAAIVRELFARILSGETTGAIGADFEHRQVSFTKRENGGKWTARRVWHLATQATYKGEFTHNGTLITVPAIVDADTWDQVQTSLTSSGRRGLSRTQHVYMLDDGHGRCGACDAPLRIQWGGRTGDIAYYVCARRLHEKSCELPWWRVDEADGLVWAEVKRVLERPDLVEAALRARSADTTTDGSLAAQDVANGEAQVARLTEAVNVWHRMFNDGNVTEVELAKNLADVARRLHLVQTTLAAARLAAERAGAAVAEIGSVLAWLAAVRKELDLADPAERRRISRGLAPSIQLDPEAVRIGLQLRDPRVDRSVFSFRCKTENHSAPDLLVTVQKKSFSTLARASGRL